MMGRVGSKTRVETSRKRALAYWEKLLQSPSKWAPPHKEFIEGQINSLRLNLGGHVIQKKEVKK